MIVLLSDQVEEVGNAMIDLLIPRLFQFCGERRHLRIPNIFLNDGLHSKMHLSAAVAPMDMTITAAVLGYRHRQLIWHMEVSLKVHFFVWALLCRLPNEI